MKLTFIPSRLLEKRLGTGNQLVYRQLVNCTFSNFQNFFTKYFKNLQLTKLTYEFWKQKPHGLSDIIFLVFYNGCIVFLKSFYIC